MRKLGSQGFEVSAQGLGCLGMTGNYGAPKLEEEMIKVIHKAVEVGITFFDTSNVYGPYINEILVGKVGATWHDWVHTGYGRIRCATGYGMRRRNLASFS